MRKKYPAEKLSPAVLSQLLASIPDGDSRLVVGPQFGEDAAVIDTRDRYLVAKVTLLP